MPQKRVVVSRLVEYAAGMDYNQLVEDAIVDCIGEMEQEFGRNRDYDIEDVEIIPVQLMSARAKRTVDIFLVITVIGVESRGFFGRLFG